MSAFRPLAVRALTLFGVLIAVLVLLVISLGATGFSDRLLEAQVNEEIRAYRQSLSQTVRDPEALEKSVAERQIEVERFYGIDEPWWQRLPPQVLRVLTLDLGTPAHSVPRKEATAFPTSCSSDCPIRSSF